MTYEQLRCFTMAAREKTFFDAAEALHVTQSALSKQIMKLETELGVRLFDRSRRSASLTEAGKYFYPKAEKLCQEYDAALTDFRQYLKTGGQTIRLGALPILTSFRLNERLLPFTKEHPEIELIQEEAEEEALLDGLNTGRYDFIIARETLVADKNIYSYRTLAEDALCAVLSRTYRGLSAPQNPAAQTEAPPFPCTPDGITYLSPERLADEPLLLMRDYTSVYRECIAMFQREQIRPEIRRTARLETVIGSAAAGEGIGLIPKSSMNTFHHPDAVILPILPAVPLNVVLAKKRRSASTPSTKLFYQALV